MSLFLRMFQSIALVLVAGALAVLGAGIAGAHPTLLVTEPGSETAVSEPPQTITLIFNEQVAPGADAIKVVDDAGRESPIDAAESSKGGRAITSRLSDAPSPGTYTVRWQVIGADGDLVEEDFRFAVGLALTDSGGGDDSASTSWTETVLRWLLFVGFALALGTIVAERLSSVPHAENPSLKKLRTWFPGGICIALVGVAGLMVSLAASSSVAALWQERAGIILLVETCGLVLALALKTVGSTRLASAALLLVIATEGLRSHANVVAPGWGAFLTAVHLAAAAIWVGALLHTVRTAFAWRGQHAPVRWVVAGYTRLALWTFIVVVTTGTISALLLIPVAAMFSTPYGQLLTVKLLFVIAASGVAITARRTMRRTEPAGKLRNQIRIESILLISVLAISAALVSTAPANSPTQPGPPAAIGPVLPLGTLAGQIGVSVAASEGQLVVRLSTPRRVDYYAQEPDQEYTLIGALRAGGVNTSLSLRGCGSGCFVAQTDWPLGESVLTLEAAATGWRGGTVSMLIPWPVQSGDTDLARAVDITRAQKNLTFYESVTSDAANVGPEPQQLSLSSEFFLAQEPYADGTAPVVVRLPSAGRQLRLAVGYPAAGMNVLLDLDQTGRIVSETLSDAKHLITRTFVYPEVN
ncbi:MULTISPECIES: copper resistance protein CopC [unclassified Rhodococcus (in: high G+C Gram-positive bacteria)]|jgi:copper transport protein|uniref:copper resistance CopC/CopD family protein n=1 Tax=unclassified Rhodococcus (in: high G+C Gram-positive bacteria) TaxID=192944 RepID=UPI0004A9A33F|nr:copper resistance protein CopC [Rhodococcus sp. GOMB7]KDQ01002.1 copper resistance protein CopC [Rhodococcus qingshengii]KLN70213.1 copper resistance protein CopC [Rhodococcus erythropolis]MBT9294678.1 copper resistance protein CopC/CopD [Rhodococcus sp. GOMB7]NHP17207.1 copper resistance protein CopC/CopD [Rhodococcus sp. IC4_135]